MVLTALVLVALVAQNVLLAQIHHKERDRLLRMALAESKAERVAALLPERKPARKREATAPPSKPIGL